MPLIIVTGLPSSGKSRTATEVGEYFKTKLKEKGDRREVRIVSDTDNLDWDGRDEIFGSIVKEKELRGAYIKGFRYELHCISKEAKTQYCLIEKLIDADVCWRLNEQRFTNEQQQQPNDGEPSAGYSRATFDALLMRYEKCDANNRWDSPLFKITNLEQALDLNKVFVCITEEEPLAPNKCTLTSTTSSTIFKPSAN